MSTARGALETAFELHQRGQLADAEKICRQIVSANPSDALAWHLLGVTAIQSGRDDVAKECIERALDIQPGLAEAHQNLGTLWRRRGMLDRAIQSYRRAVQLKPHLSEAHFSLGRALHDQGELDEAIESYGNALRVRPGYADALNDLAAALGEAGRPAEAIAVCQRSIAVDPNCSAAHYNLGLVLKDEGRIGEAICAYRKVLELDSGLAFGHLNLAQLLLLSAEFQTGWVEYEWRWRTGQLVARTFEQPTWEGEALEGRTILLWAEQGLGDTIQFIRYAALVMELGAMVLVECQRPLVALLSGCAGVDHLIPGGDSLPPFNVQAPLLSLPRICGTTVDTIPASVPYLFADRALVERWRQKLAYLHDETRQATAQVPYGVRNVLIGINWSGRTMPGLHKQRDIPLEHFTSLATIPGLRLISLQKDGSEEIADAGLPIVDLGPEIDTAHGAFMDTAAIMMNLDLVITSDTSIPHLAGALGVPVWLALPYVPDWRWMLDRSDSPWYPTMRLFRQKSRGDWAGVISEIRQALSDLVSNKPPHSVAAH
jgi:tetratricopeptide (TPR) repeat protein